ncbi:MAG TPA: YceI family protein, partial [Myxococcota bacterium]|nr:YceI family protein [Myxococcota bacterium]
MSKLGSLALTAALALAVQARAADSYEIDPVHSSVLWKVQHMGAGHVWGRFTDFSGSLRLDAAAPAGSSEPPKPAEVSDWKEELFSTLHACPTCRLSFEELEPRTFSFNSPYGACQACEGLGSRSG